MSTNQKESTAHLRGEILRSSCKTSFFPAIHFLHIPQGQAPASAPNLPQHPPQLPRRRPLQVRLLTLIEAQGDLFLSPSAPVHHAELNRICQFVWPISAIRYLPRLAVQSSCCRSYTLTRWLVGTPAKAIANEPQLPIPWCPFGSPSGCYQPRVCLRV